MKICKVKPSKKECEICKINAFHMEESVDCDKCQFSNNVYELVALGYNRSIGDWAMVYREDGKIERVKLDRVYDVREVIDINTFKELIKVLCQEVNQYNSSASCEE